MRKRQKGSIDQNETMSEYVSIPGTSPLCLFIDRSDSGVVPHPAVVALENQPANYEVDRLDVVGCPCFVASYGLFFSCGQKTTP